MSLYSMYVSLELGALGNPGHEQPYIVIALLPLIVKITFQEDGANNNNRLV